MYFRTALALLFHCWSTFSVPLVFRTKRLRNMLKWDHSAEMRPGMKVTQKFNYAANVWKNTAILFITELCEMKTLHSCRVGLPPRAVCVGTTSLELFLVNITNVSTSPEFVEKMLEIYTISLRWQSYTPS